jgi:hypothetical protein
LLRVYFYVVLDLCCTYKLAHKINVGLRQKIYYGSSPMVCSDCSPIVWWVYPSSATFRVEFIAEPIATLHAPFKIAGQIIGDQPGVGASWLSNLRLF